MWIQRYEKENQKENHGQVLRQRMLRVATSVVLQDSTLISSALLLSSSNPGEDHFD